MRIQQPLPNDACIQSEHFRRLTWRERLKIAIGYNIKTIITTRVAKRQGHAQQACKVEVVPHSTAEDQARTDAL